MAARKQRDGISGFEVPFTPERVELGLDDDGDPITAIVLDWGKPRNEPGKKAGRKPKAFKLLCRLLAEIIADKWFVFQPDPGRPTGQTCYRTDLQNAFNQRYHAEGSPRQKRDKRTQAYKRAMETALEDNLIATRDLTNGSEIIWARK